MRTIKRLVIHCTATSPNASIEAIKNYWHTPKRNAQTGARSPYIPKVQGGLGWRTGGYHVIIEHNGNASRQYSDARVTNGVRGYNQDSIHISLVGGRNGVQDFSQDQWCELENQVHYYMNKYPGIDVVGHRDLSPDRNGDGEITPNEWVKRCPCFDVSTWLKTLPL